VSEDTEPLAQADPVELRETTEPPTGGEVDDHEEDAPEAVREGD
jgi:hypothetical protein